MYLPALIMIIPHLHHLTQGQSMTLIHPLHYLHYLLPILPALTKGFRLIHFLITFVPSLLFSSLLIF